METKEVKKKSTDEYYGDLTEYVVHRILLSINKTEDKDVAEDIKIYVESALLLLSDDDNIKDTISRILLIDDLIYEFETTFGDRYSNECSCCQDKIDKGELKTDNNTCEGC